MNTLTYSELQDICLAQKITMSEFVNAIGITYQGLKSALDRQSLGVKYVINICNLLHITPNQFFHLENNITNNNGYIHGLLNTQNVGIAGIDVLKEQLTKKDEQIDKLLTLLNK